MCFKNLVFIQVFIICDIIGAFFQITYIIDEFEVGAYYELL